MYDSLVLFIKIVKSGSFTKAAKETGITKQILTKKIQGLEKSLNISLLEPDIKEIKLTFAGQELYDKFCNFETDVDKLVNEINKSRNQIRGKLNVLLPPFFALKLISPYLVDFLIRNPKISLNITYQNKSVNFIKDNFDLAIINHLPDKPAENIRLLCRSKVIFYCYPDYIKNFSLPITQEQVEDSLIMGVISDHLIPKKITYLISKSSGNETVFNHKYRIVQNSGAHDQSLAETGLTIGAGMDIMMKNDIKLGIVQQLLPDYYLPGFEYYLLINPESHNARINIFVEFIDKCLQRLNLDKNLSLP